MKKLFFVVLLFLIFKPAPSFALTLYPQIDQETETLQLVNNSIVGERIDNFTADITINADGSIDVKETINYFFDTDRHGIFRNIPFTTYDESARYDLAYTFHSVTDENGKKYNYEKSKDGEQWVLKIGDPDKTITGNHTYIISYSVKGALGYFDDHDELYWNVTGNGWNIPIKKTTVTILLPTKVGEEQIRLDCFTGAYGSTKNNCTAVSDGQKTTFSTTLFLNSYEGLTVVKSFPKGTTATLLPEKYIPFFERWYGKITLAGIIIGATFWYLFLPVYLIIRWFQKGRDPFVGRPVTATFDPPKIGNRLLTPAESGALLDEHVDKRDIFATIIDLARRGYLKIEEPVVKDFHLRRTPTSKKNDKLLDFEYKLLNGVFLTDDYISIKKTKIYATVAEVETMLYTDLVEHKFFPKNPRSTRNIYYGIGAAGMMTFNFVLAFVAFFFGRIMPAKTREGAHAAVEAQGLKNFLSSQERQLNFQGDKQMLFEKLLPYAAAFGVEKAWAKRFEGFDMKNPDWYQGTSGSHFNTALFASHLSNSYSSFAASSTPPSSSGSGFSGGSSGGGGGGGGGGSW